MKRMKHLLAMMAVLLYSLTVSAEKVEIDGIWYNLIPETEEAEVTYEWGNFHQGFHSDYSGSITIPSMVNYFNVWYRVTRIGDHAFEWCTGLTAVNIPDIVTSLGEFAFAECSDLTAIALPKELTSI